MAYLREFKEAIEYTKKLGMNPDVVFTQERYLVPKYMDGLAVAVRDDLGELTEADLVAQCLSIHFRLIPSLERLFGIRPVLTFGYIDDGGKARFKVPDDYFDRLTVSGLSRGTFDAHAWLTLPSMEIIDFSLPTSMAVVNGWHEGRGLVLSGHADDLKHGLSYHPQLVGDNCIGRFGLLQIAS
jgi:hypothetical protein